MLASGTVVHVVGTRSECYGVCDYARQFENVIAAAGFNLEAVCAAGIGVAELERIVRSTRNPIVHYECSSTANSVFRLLVEVTRSFPSWPQGITVHDSPRLVWSAGEQLYGSPLDGWKKGLRELLDWTWGSWVERKIFENVKFLVVLTKTGAQLLGKRSPCIGRKVVFVPFVCEEYACERGALPSAERPIRLLFFGQVRRSKGLEYLLEQLGRVPEKRFHLTIIGATPDKWRPLPRYAGRTPLDWLGFVDDSQMRGLFRDIDAAIFPYLPKRTVSASSALMRIMVSGICPIVPDDYPPLQEYVKDRVNGLYFPRKALSAWLTSDLPAVSVLWKLGMTAMETCRKSYSVQTIAALLAELYRKASDNWTAKSLVDV